ncbi:MAG: FAD-binding oxidoreductase [Marinibacterium sp.]|nr:FAD-binding oxidoreductase [Marinibacterium sp.]
MSMTKSLSGWGRWPVRDCQTIPLRVDAGFGDGPGFGARTAIARGNGRSYGDPALNPDMTVEATAARRMLSFDIETGELVLEAGVMLADVLSVFVPRGWFPPVTPGTKLVTIGGMIGADVHGKNHHGAGSFADHVNWFDLLCADGRVRRCSPQENADLFHATCGGMGLTGHILAASIRLQRVGSAWIRQTTVPVPDLDGAMEVFETNLDTTYSVAWIDCLAGGADRGRSLVYLGEHAEPDALEGTSRSDPFHLPPRRRKRMPMDAPGWALNRLSLRAFNHVYYRAGCRAAGPGIVDYDSYFYPLDSIDNWNRLYGARGFAQYQCALPLSTARDALLEQLDAISGAGLGSFLAVLKRLGPGAAARPLSFPIEGYTLALDFPVSSRALTLLDRLDEITIAAGGRLYLAKDSRMTQSTAEAGYGAALTRFRTLRAETGASAIFQSLQSRRLAL